MIVRLHQVCFTDNFPWTNGWWSR